MDILSTRVENCIPFRENVCFLATTKKKKKDNDDDFTLTVQATNNSAFENFHSLLHGHNSNVIHQRFQPKIAWKIYL